MKRHPLKHGTFSIERSYAASPARVFAAWADIETKARWFIGPRERWRVVKRELDLRVGGTETGEVEGQLTTLFTARYHAIVPNQRLVYAYDMHLGDRHYSVSLATVELEPTPSGGTRMTFTEQAVFFEGDTPLRSREDGTAAHFDRLAPVLEDPREVVSARVFDVPAAVLYGAFAEPRRLASWWGPRGFRNTFDEFELRPGGAWRFTMHGPDGTDYPNRNEFIEVVPAERIVFRHAQAGHGFQMTMTLRELGDQTLLIWRMSFDDVADAERVRAIVAEKNEENFDRLAAHLATERTS
jgi:uncharacterized protein YndB with AHSA1/START domain